MAEEKNMKSTGQEVSDEELASVIGGAGESGYCKICGCRLGRSGAVYCGSCAKQVRAEHIRTMNAGGGTTKMEA